MITLFGTCRLNHIKNHTHLNNLINYTHSTKEVIQMIQFIRGEHAIPPPYNVVCFRTGIMQRCGIEYCDSYPLDKSPGYDALTTASLPPMLSYQDLLKNTEICIIEICSRKKYMHVDNLGKTYYLHHLCVDPRKTKHHSVTPAEIMKTYIIEQQSDAEIERDILEIRQRLYPKKIVVVSHYDAQIDGECIVSRHELICLLKTLCETHQIPFVNPTEVLQDFPQEDVMKPDLGHYTELGLSEFSRYMDQYVSTM
jgi:hypothetical protein